MRGTNVNVTVMKFGSPTKKFEVEKGTNIIELLEEAELYNGTESIRLNGETINPEGVKLSDGDQIGIVKAKEAGI